MFRLFCLVRLCNNMDLMGVEHGEKFLHIYFLWLMLRVIYVKVTHILNPSLKL